MTSSGRERMSRTMRKRRSSRTSRSGAVGRPESRRPTAWGLTPEGFGQLRTTPDTSRSYDSAKRSRPRTSPYSRKSHDDAGPLKNWQLFRPDWPPGHTSVYR